MSRSQSSRLPHGVIATTDAALDALSRLTLPDPPSIAGRRYAFLGCGDSLAAARPAELRGHRVISAGDIAWGGMAPAGVDGVVALSWSGRTGATLRAVQISLEAGLPVISLTSDGGSPIAQASDHHVELPKHNVREAIPAIGYALHAGLVHRLCDDEAATPANLAALWRQAAPAVEQIAAECPHRPDAITVASMPDARGAAEFWSLKLIEATGLSVRIPAIEETGHVDYFIGPQDHLTVALSVAPADRAVTLTDALRTNGHQATVVTLDRLVGVQAPRSVRELVGGLLGADLARTWAIAWHRPPFRGGAVDMSGSHIHTSGETR